LIARAAPPFHSSDQGPGAPSPLPPDPGATFFERRPRKRGGARAFPGPSAEWEIYTASNLHRLRRSFGAQASRFANAMIDYHALILRAVAGLEPNTEETRGLVYERTRAALAAHLQALNPPLSESDRMQQRLALEEAFRRVEA